MRNGADEWADPKLPNNMNVCLIVAIIRAPVQVKIRPGDLFLQLVFL